MEERVNEACLYRNERGTEARQRTTIGLQNLIIKTINALSCIEGRGDMI